MRITFWRGSLPDGDDGRYVDWATAGAHTDLSPGRKCCTQPTELTRRTPVNCRKGEPETARWHLKFTGFRETGAIGGFTGWNDCERQRVQAELRDGVSPRAAWDRRRATFAP